MGYPLSHRERHLIRDSVTVALAGLFLTVSYAQSAELEAGKPKDIGKLSAAAFKPGVMGPWIFYPSDNYQISTEQHPGLLTIRDLESNEDLKEMIGQPLPLSDYSPQWEFEVNLFRSQASKRGFMSPDDRDGCDAIGLNVAITFMDWYVLDREDNQVTSWLPGVANTPGEGHSAGSLIMESYDQTDRINRGRVKKVWAGGESGPQFVEKVPESILSRRPLFLLFRVIDSRHLQMGVKAYAEDHWILTPVCVCPSEIARLGDSCISTYTGLDGAPAYQQFLIDYRHCREGMTGEY